MNCNYCGYEVSEDCKCCPNCGENPKTRKKNPYKEKNVKKEYERTTIDTEKLVPLWGILGFFMPIIGLILFCVWKNPKPKEAAASGIGALSRVIIYILFYSFNIFVRYIFSR